MKRMCLSHRYKSLESKLNEFNAGCGDLAAARQTWLRLWDGKPARASIHRAPRSPALSIKDGT